EQLLYRSQPRRPCSDDADLHARSPFWIVDGIQNSSRRRSPRARVGYALKVSHRGSFARLREELRGIVASDAGPEPVLEVGERCEVHPREEQRGRDPRNVDVRGGDVLADEARRLPERLVEHREQRTELALGDVCPLRDALLRGQEVAMPEALED